MLAPGEQLRLTARIHPPMIPGQYRLVLDLMRDTGGWFKLDKILSVEIHPVTARRATLVIDNYGRRDAISDNVRHKLRLLSKWGFVPLILTHRIDTQLPLADQAYVVEVKPEQLFRPDPNHEWVTEHFWQSQIYMFEYPGYYPLVDLLRVAPNSPAILDYHRNTPTAHRDSRVSVHELDRETNNTEIVASADYAIAHSEDARRRLLATGLIAPERVVVMHYGVPIDHFHPRDHSKIPPELKDAHGPVLLYVGGMDGNTRVETLVRMVAHVRQEYADVRLLLVADEQSTSFRSMDATTGELIAGLGVEDNVIFAGWKDHDELPAYYNACDVYVTSSGNEGFSVAVAEAMASRKPVVAAAAAALPWIVGDAGYLFEPGNVEEFAEHVLAVLHSKVLAEGQVKRSSLAPTVEGT